MAKRADSPLSVKLTLWRFRLTLARKSSKSPQIRGFHPPKPTSDRQNPLFPCHRGHGRYRTKSKHSAVPHAPGCLHHLHDAPIRTPESHAGRRKRRATPGITPSGHARTVPEPSFPHSGVGPGVPRHRKMVGIGGISAPTEASRRISHPTAPASETAVPSREWCPGPSGR